MTILCSIDGEIIRRYDNSDPDGATHIGRIVAGTDHDDVAGLVEAFRLNPPSCLAVPRSDPEAEAYYEARDGTV